MSIYSHSNLDTARGLAVAHRALCTGQATAPLHPERVPFTEERFGLSPWLLDFTTEWDALNYADRSGFGLDSVTHDDAEDRWTVIVPAGLSAGLLDLLESEMT